MGNEERQDESVRREALDAERAGLENDLFYHGTILRLFPKKNTGIVRTSSGREIPFSYDLVDLSGPVKNARELREGLVVGYDMGWTSGGLKVTKIKTYRRSTDEQPEDVAATTSAEDSERKQRERKDLK